MSKLYDICLIGLGPAGIGFLSTLDEGVLKNSICFEQGNTNTTCTCYTKSKCSRCDQCSIVSGVGGASRFSCGKISNFPAGSGMLPFWDLQEEALENFLNSQIVFLKEELDLCKVDVSLETQAKAKALFETEGIAYKYYDVYEFKKDRYISYLSKKVEEAQANGLQINYNTEVLNVEKSVYQNERVYLITIKSKEGVSNYCAKKVIVATGNINSNCKLMQNLTSNVSQTSYELGIRITVPTKKIANVLDCHGDLKLKYKDGRTYCVSKNGFIISYSVNEALFLEGYTDSTESSKLTNLAIIIKCDNLNILNAFKEKYKKVYSGIPIKQTYNDYINNKLSDVNFAEKYIPVQQGNVKNIFADEINDKIIDFIESVLIKTVGLDRDDIVIYAPELKESIRFNINNDFQVDDNLYVIGAATGRFRGILQSMCAGIHCARSLRR